MECGSAERKVGGLWCDEQDPERQVKGRFKEQELDHPGSGGCQVVRDTGVSIGIF